MSYEIPSDAKRNVCPDNSHYSVVVVREVEHREKPTFEVGIDATKDKIRMRLPSGDWHFLAYELAKWLESVFRIECFATGPIKTEPILSNETTFSSLP